MGQVQAANDRYLCNQGGLDGTNPLKLSDFFAQGGRPWQLSWSPAD